MSRLIALRSAQTWHMRTLLNLPRATWMFAIASLARLGIGGFAIGWLMLPHSGPWGERIGKMTCLQLAFTNERVTNIILSFSAEAQQAMLRLRVPGDLSFARS